MNQLKLIKNSNTKSIKAIPRKPDYTLYMKALDKIIDSYTDDVNSLDIKSNLRKIIFYGVKAVNTKPTNKAITWEEAESHFKLIQIVKGLIASLTPLEFMKIFPITKEYQGNKWGCKDYFYTMDNIRSLGEDKPIGDKIDNFLWDYWNIEVSIFLVNIMRAVDDLRYLSGQPSMATEWAEMNGIETFTLCTSGEGKQYLYSKKTGKTSKVSTARERPKWIKLVK